MDARLKNARFDVKIVERQQMHIRPFVQAQGDGEIHQRAATGSPGRGASSGRQG